MARATLRGRGLLSAAVVAVVLGAVGLSGALPAGATSTPNTFNFEWHIVGTPPSGLVGSGGYGCTGGPQFIFGIDPSAGDGSESFAQPADAVCHFTQTVAGATSTYSCTTTGDASCDAPDGHVITFANAGTGTISVTITFASSVTVGDITVASPTGTTLRDVTTSPPTGAPAGLVFPVGLVGFTVDDVTPGATIHVEIAVKLQLPQPVSSYWKFQDGTWSQFAGAEINAGNTVVLTLTDGGAGDADHTVNGSITDPGGPAYMSAAPPPATPVPAAPAFTG
jgi:hypothetical protein